MRQKNQQYMKEIYASCIHLYSKEKIKMGTFTKEFWLDFTEEGEQNKNDLIKIQKTSPKSKSSD